MWTIISWIGNLLTSLVQWMFKLANWKALVFGVLLFILSPLMLLLEGLIQSLGLDGIAGLFNALPEGLRYYLVLFKLEVGLPLVVAAMLTKFFIRRLPVVG